MENNKYIFTFVFQFDNIINSESELEHKDISCTGVLRFERRSDINNFKIIEYTNSGLEKDSSLSLLIDNLTKDSINLKIFYEEDNNLYSIAEFDKINYLINTLSSSVISDNNAEFDVLNDFKFIRVFEVR